MVDGFPFREAYSPRRILGCGARRHARRHYAPALRAGSARRLSNPHRSTPGRQALAKETSTRLRTTENTEEHNIVAIGHDEPKATGPETLVRVNRQPSMTAVSLLRTLCPLCSLWLASICIAWFLGRRQYGRDDLPDNAPPSTLTQTRMFGA